MALHYITGVAGTGKSTLRNLLLQKGYLAYDVDEDDIAMWHHRQTGQAVPQANLPQTLDPQWYQDYQWRLDQKRVETIAKTAETQDIFLCGTSANDQDIHRLLTNVIFLMIDEQTLRHRLATRDTNVYGKTDYEVEHIVNWLKPAEDYYRNLGALMLDSTQKLEDLLDSIISHTTSLGLNLVGNHTEPDEASLDLS